MADDADNTDTQLTDTTSTIVPDTTSRSAPAAVASMLASASWSNYKRWSSLGVIVLVLIIGVPYLWELWTFYQTHESTDDAYVVGDIIPISARVSGTVVEVMVKENQPVEAGQLLAQLDQRDFKAQVQQAEAAVSVIIAQVRQAELEVTQEQDSTSSDTARTSASLRVAQSERQGTQHITDEALANLRTLETGITVAQAEVDAQDAHLNMARMEYERSQQLFADGVVAQQQLDATQSAWEAAQAERRVAEQKLTQARREVERAQVDLRTKRQSVERSRAQEAAAAAVLAGSQAKRQNVAIKQAQVEVKRAQLQQKQADLDFAKLQLAYTTLRSPAAGVVARKNLEVGQVVQAGRPVLAIVPRQALWVVANFKETQLHRMQPGQSVSLEVDAYPDETFNGKIDSLSPGTGSIFSLLPPENATGNFVKVVQRVPVKIVLDQNTSSDLVLRRGMSVIATVATHE